MTYIFDGNAFASVKKANLVDAITTLKKSGITPKLVSIIVGDNPASLLYVNLKKKRAEEVGCEMLVVKYEKNVSEKLDEQITSDIKKFNADKNVHGIMVQLPLPDDLRYKTHDIINAIASEKDVDGLRVNSPFLHPTSKAVIEILKEALRSVPSKESKLKIVIVGATGMVGKPLLRELKNKNLSLIKNTFEIIECSSQTQDLKEKTLDADILISATGVPGLITKEMLKDGVILIDVGAPKGDISQDAYENASFVSPVPGGVGPVTIVCLLENLLASAKVKQSLY